PADRAVFVLAAARDFAPAVLAGPPARRLLEEFLRVFLDIRLPFVAFAGSINRLLRVESRQAQIGAAMGKSDGLGTGLQGTRRTAFPPVECGQLGWMTCNSTDQGMAAMPAQERPLPTNGASRGGNVQSSDYRQHREAMARNTSPKGPNPRIEVQPPLLD